MEAGEEGGCERMTVQRCRATPAVRPAAQRRFGTLPVLRSKRAERAERVSKNKAAVVMDTLLKNVFRENCD